jgi:acetyltransferase-like isoleucine patch superfamily enzyme
LQAWLLLLGHLPHKGGPELVDVMLRARMVGYAAQQPTLEIGRPRRAQGIVGMSRYRKALTAGHAAVWCCVTALGMTKLFAITSGHGQRLSASVARSARISPGVNVVSVGTGVCRLTVGERSIIESGVTLRLTGGAELWIGDDVTIRRGCVLNVAGRLAFHGSNLLSWHSVVHCAEAVDFEVLSGTGEMVTVVDGTHYRGSPTDHWYHNSRTAPVRIGANSWLATKATVAQGVTLGRGVTVAAGSVVTNDMPDDCLVAGAPAKVVRIGING